MKKILAIFVFIISVPLFAGDINETFESKTIVLMKNGKGLLGLPSLIDKASNKIKEVVLSIGNCSFVEVKNSVSDDIINSFKIQLIAQDCENLDSLKINSMGRFLVLREMELDVKFKTFFTKMNIKY